MHERFLAGADSEFFDYTQVDCNEEYDDRKTVERDREDDWFDKEEAGETKQGGSEYTGILDY